MPSSCGGRFASTKGSGAILKRSGRGCVRSNGALPTCSRIGVGLNLRLDDGSWMNREVHVQFWEGVGLRCPALLAYLRAYESVAEARQGIASYFQFYNNERFTRLSVTAPRARSSRTFGARLILARGKIV